MEYMVCNGAVGKKLCVLVSNEKSTEDKLMLALLQHSSCIESLLCIHGLHA